MYSSFDMWIRVRAFPSAYWYMWLLYMCLSLVYKRKSRMKKNHANRKGNIHIDSSSISWASIKLIFYLNVVFFFSMPLIHQPSLFLSLVPLCRLQFWIIVYSIRLLLITSHISLFAIRIFYYFGFRVCVFFLLLSFSRLSLLLLLLWFAFTVHRALISSSLLHNCSIPFDCARMFRFQLLDYLWVYVRASIEGFDFLLF